MMKKVRELKAGEFFMTSPSSKTVYVMGTLRGWRYFKEFDRQTKKYTATNFNDISDEKAFGGDKSVFVDFVF